MRGALTFHFPEVVRALRDRGLVPRGPDLCALEGTDAIAAAFAANREAALEGLTLREIDLVSRLERRSDAYCRALFDVLAALRANA